MNKIKQIKYPLITVIFLLLILSIFLLKKNLNQHKYEIVNSKEEFIEDELSNEKEKNNFQKINKRCTVDIKGAVLKPGVYTIDCDKNISYVIKLAGGLTKEANTSLINLAKRVIDEMVIIIYTNEEVKNSNLINTVVKVVEKECHCPNIENDGCINQKLDQTITNKKDFSNKNNSNKLININTATAKELETIPNIGESKSFAIIEYRNKNGKFNKIEDILNVNGIGEKLYEEIKIYITT